MFNTEDLKCLDPKYFNIIAVDDYDVTIMSRNTGHYWYMNNPEYPGEGSVVIFHKHKFSHPYHQHGRVNTLRQAVRGIKCHDKWQMGGKKNRVTRVEKGSVKYFVFLVKSGSFLVRIQIWQFLSKRSIFYGSCKGTNPTDYCRKQH